MAESAIYYDASKCTGCKGCQINCKQWNQLPAPFEQSPWTGSYESPASNSDTTWLRITFNEESLDDGDKVGWCFGRNACQHCTDAACAKVCPANAYTHTAEGAVALDSDKCIGCHFCAGACPFDIPHYNAVDEKAHKCWMCQDRIRNGIRPACVTTCPTGALQFGERDDMLAMAKDRVAQIKPIRPDAVVYGENEMGGLHVVQVLPYGAEAHGMPISPRENIVNTTERLLRPLTLFGVLGVSAVAIASFIGGRHFSQAEALKHAYPEDYGRPSDVVVDEIIVEEGRDA
ncbi:MAG: 4Fe-4S dicluster domain-containing protein [Coriobacteriia bacterium]|nr:4Fe-4S dicluster domain-containing protein [Coriobacteriia bacterium]